MLKRIHAPNICFRGNEVYRIYMGRKPVLDLINARDFYYDYDYMQNNTCDLIKWKQTLNGVPNKTHLIVPDDPVLWIYNDRLVKAHLNQITHLIVPQNVVCYFSGGGAFGGYFRNDTCLEYVDISGSYQSHYTNDFCNCTNLKYVKIGPNAIYMENAFNNCTNLTSAVCSEETLTMASTYYNCTNLTEAICGNKVANMSNCYARCINIKGDAYFYSKDIYNAHRCFYGRNTSNRLNIYIPKDSDSVNVLTLPDSASSITGNQISWTYDIRCCYNTLENIYIYPVDDVEEAKKDNERLIISYRIAEDAEEVPYPLINPQFIETELYHDGNIEGKETITIGPCTYVKLTDNVNVYDIHNIILNESTYYFGEIEKTERYCDMINRFPQYFEKTYAFEPFYIFIATEDMSFHYQDTVGYDWFDETIDIKKGIWVLHDVPNEEYHTYYPRRFKYMKYDKVIPSNDIEYEARINIDKNEISLYCDNKEDIHSISFIGQPDLYEIRRLGVDTLTSTSYMFAGCVNLQELGDYVSWNLKNITSSKYMFDGCLSIFEELK